MKALIIPAAIVFLIVSACTDNRSSSTITKPANEATSTKVEISTKPFVLPHDYPAEVKEALAKAEAMKKAEEEALEKALEKALEEAAELALSQPFYMGTSRMGD